MQGIAYLYINTIALGRIDTFYVYPRVNHYNQNVRSTQLIRFLYPAKEICKTITQHALNTNVKQVNCQTV